MINTSGVNLVRTEIKKMTKRTKLVNSRSYRKHELSGNITHGNNKTNRPQVERRTSPQCGYLLLTLTRWRDGRTGRFLPSAKRDN